MKLFTLKCKLYERPIENLTLVEAMYYNHWLFGNNYTEFRIHCNSYIDQKVLLNQENENRHIIIDQDTGKPYKLTPKDVLDYINHVFKYIILGPAKYKIEVNYVQCSSETFIRKYATQLEVMLSCYYPREGYIDLSQIPETKNWTLIDFKQWFSENFHINNGSSGWEEEVYCTVKDSNDNMVMGDLLEELTLENCQDYIKQLKIFKELEDSISRKNFTD